MEREKWKRPDQRATEIALDYLSISFEIPGLSHGGWLFCYLQPNTFLPDASGWSSPTVEKATWQEEVRSLWKLAAESMGKKKQDQHHVGVCYQCPQVSPRPPPAVS